MSIPFYDYKGKYGYCEVETVGAPSDEQSF